MIRKGLKEICCQRCGRVGCYVSVEGGGAICENCYETKTRGKPGDVCPQCGKRIAVLLAHGKRSGFVVCLDRHTLKGWLKNDLQSLKVCPRHGVPLDSMPKVKGADGKPKKYCPKCRNGGKKIFKDARLKPG